MRWPNDAFQTADSEDATVGREGGGEEGGESQKGLRNYEIYRSDFISLRNIINLKSTQH